jgi:hypothetical protein
MRFHQDILVHMYSQKFYTKETFPFLEAITNWREGES